MTKFMRFVKTAHSRLGWNETTRSHDRL